MSQYSDNLIMIGCDSGKTRLLDVTEMTLSNINIDWILPPMKD
jgi:hypothetical protein